MLGKRHTETGRRLAGQGMTEYIIIVALVAIAAIAAFTYFGQTVRSQTAGVSAELAGQDSKAAVQEAKDAAKAALKEAKDSKGLADYGDGN